MANTCREAIEEVFKDNPGLLTTKEVIRMIYKRYPNKPWKTNPPKAGLVLFVAGGFNHRRM